MARRSLFFLVALFAVGCLWTGGAMGFSLGKNLLSAEIVGRIEEINSRPAWEKLDSRRPTDSEKGGEMKGGAKALGTNAADSFFSSLGLDAVTLDPDEIKEMEETKKALQGAGLSEADIDNALAMMERQIKMDRLGLEPADIAKAMMKANIAGKGKEMEGKGGSPPPENGFPKKSAPLIADAPLSSAAEGVDGMDEKQKARWALGLADHMAVATFYDIVDASMLKTAGLAVAAYPHPLLLNNYAGMLQDSAPMDALFFYFAAESLEPRNPVILTNIAMAFLDMNDFGAAKNYATQALTENPEFGPAFQVLTICHLKDENSVLAAETLMKSARDCFDDLSMRLFDDYIAEVGELDVTEGEKYPLPEEQLAILYEIAKKYGDPERENTKTDTPSAQIKIAPFPNFGSADSYLSSSEFLTGDAERRSARLTKLSMEKTQLERAVFENEGSRGTLPLLKNMRQYYAYRVLESYYHFKMRELNWKLQQEDPTDKLLERYVREYMSKCSVFRKQEHDFHVSFIQQAKGTKNEEAEWLRKGIRLYTASIGHMNELLNITRKYTLEHLNFPQKEYEKRKQLVEEFWLKAGGLMKYMTVREVYNLAANRRELFAVDTMDIFPTAGYAIPNFGTEEGRQAIDEAPLGLSPPFLCQISPVGLEGMLDYIRHCEEEVAQLRKSLDALLPPPKILQKYTFDADPVEIEKTGLTTFKEAGDLPLIGIEGQIPFSDKHTAYADGEKSTWIISGEGGSRGAIHDRGSGTMTIFDAAPKQEKTVYDQKTGEAKPAPASAFDVGAKLTAVDELGQKLDAASDYVRSKIFKNTSGKETKGSNPLGAIFKGADILKKGQESIGFFQAAANIKTAGNRMFGEYVTRDKNHRVIDHGLVYIRQVGGSLPVPNSPELGREVMVMKSRITGVSTKQEFTQYKFKFASVRTR
jgi:tetratricopeptide (TPR) repeat protein